MGEFSDQRRGYDYEVFVGRWVTQLVAVFLRAVRDPALAYDLTTETLAAAHLQWEFAPADDDAVAWVLQLAADVLGETMRSGRVPLTERRRRHQPNTRRLSVTEQQEIMALAEERLELPTAARDAADALARMAPPPHALSGLRLSRLVQAEPLPDREKNPYGS